MARQPGLNDHMARVSAYLTDETFGYDHWRAAQYSAPKRDKFGLLLLFDTAEERDAAEVVHMKQREKADA